MPFNKVMKMLGLGTKKAEAEAEKEAEEKNRLEEEKKKKKSSMLIGRRGMSNKEFEELEKMSK